MAAAGGSSGPSPGCSSSRTWSASSRPGVPVHRGGEARGPLVLAAAERSGEEAVDLERGEGERGRERGMHWTREEGKGDLMSDEPRRGVRW